MDAEVLRLNSLNKPAQPKPDTPAEDPETDVPRRPLSPSRLQPVVAPEVPLVPDLDEVLRIRAEIPRALKKRGSTDVSQVKMMPVLQPNPYRQMMSKLFRRKSPQTRSDIEGESSSSDEENPLPPNTNLPALMATPMTPQQKVRNRKKIMSTTCKCVKTRDVTIQESIHIDMIRICIPVSRWFTLLDP